MEYNLQLEQKRRTKIFIALIMVAILIMLAAFRVLGIMGLIAYSMFLGCFIVSPLFVEKYKSFLFLWIFVIPLFDKFSPLLIGSTSIITYLLTGLSIPLALIIFYRKSLDVFKDMPIIIFMFLFLGIIGINVLRSTSLISGASEFLSYFIQIFILFNLYAYLKQGNFSKLREKVFNWFNAFVILNCTAAIFQKFTGFGLTVLDGVARVKGFLGHPNGFAFLLNIYLPLGIYKSLTETDPKKKKFWIAGTVLSFLSLIITFSKTSYLLFGLMFFILLFYMPFKLKAKIFVLSLISIICFVSIDFLFKLNIIQNIIERFNNNSSLEWRFEVWNYMLYGITKGNILFGNGMDSAKFYLLNYIGVSVPPHNVYLQMIFEYGICSIFYFMTFIFLGIKFLKASLSREIKNRLFYVVPLIIIAEILVDMFVSNSVLLRSTMYFCWVILTIFYFQLNREIYSK